MDQIVYQLLADCKFGNAGLKQLASGYNSPLRVQPTLHASLQLGSPLDQFPAVCPSSTSDLPPKSTPLRNAGSACSSS